MNKFHCSPRVNAASRARSVLTLTLGLTLATPLFAHEGEDHSKDKKAAPAAAAQAAALPGAAGREAPARLADGSLFVPKAVQRQLGLRTVIAVESELAATIELNGRVVADPAAGGRVQATQAGTVMPSGRAFPVAGQRVRRGQVLAQLRPSVDRLELAAQRAQVAELDAARQLAASRVERLAQLEGSVPAKEIEAAAVELKALDRRLAAVRGGLEATLPLVAPVDGVLSVVHVVAGEVVDARGLLFEIVDPTRLAVEALVYEPGQAVGLVDVDGQAGDVRLQLEMAGIGLQLREQALPLMLRIRSASGALAVGQPVKVYARRAAGGRGLVLPRSALSLTAGGQTVVWVHTEAERFEPRRLQQGALDAGSIAVTGGLKAGERVVTGGATLLTQVR